MNNTYNNLLKIYDLPTVNTFVCNTNQDMVIFYISVYCSKICYGRNGGRRKL